MEGGALRGIVVTAVAVVLLPLAVRAADPEAAFEHQFGAEASGVRASRDRGDDVAFAAKLLKAADDLQDDPRMKVFLYEKAYWFGIKGPRGRKTAIQAARRLMELVPGKKDFWEEKVLMADFLVVAEKKDSGDRNSLIRKMVTRFVALADARAAEGKYARAADLYREAIRGASYFDPKRKAAIVDKLKAISARAETDQRLQVLKQRLKAEPANKAAAAALLRLLLVEMDDPKAAAEQAVLCAKDETEKRLLLVAGMKLKHLPEKALLALGNWYTDLATGAGPARGAMLRRAKTYYERYLAVHADEDESRLLVKAKLGQVTKDLEP